MSLKHHLITIFRCLQFSFVPRPGGQQFTPSGCLRRCTVRLFPGHSLPKKGICFEFFRPRSTSHSLGRCCFCGMRSPPREGTASGKRLFSTIGYHASSSSIKFHMFHHVEGRRHTPVVCNERRKPHTNHYPNRPVTTKNNQLLKPAIILVDR